MVVADRADWLVRVEAALQDADAQLVTEIGGRSEATSARLWRGQVLVDWQPDASAGDCLLRADLLRQLVAHHARLATERDQVALDVPGRVVARLSARHAELVRRLGGARRVSLRIRLHFDGATYIGGDESYMVRDSPLLKLNARVLIRSANTALPHTSPAPR